MALLLQRLIRAQHSQRPITQLQGGYALSAFREFATAAPAAGRASSSSRAEGTAPRFYKYVGVTPASVEVC